MKNEIWKPIEGFEGVYEVSNHGRIKSLKFVNRILKGWDNGEGYINVDLFKDNQGNKFPIHRIVAKTFIQNNDNKPQVNHINGDKKDNRFENLEWVTSRENNCHRFRKNKFRGVIFLSSKGRKKCWVAQITIEGKNKRIGYFLTEEEAAQARVKFESDNGIKNKYL